MDIIDKAGRAAGDLVARARERERIRLEDRLSQLDKIAVDAATVTDQMKHRYGYSWTGEAERGGLRATAAAANIGDDQLTAAVDKLRGIESPDEGPAPVTDLEAAYREVVKRLGELRRETLAEKG